MKILQVCNTDFYLGRFLSPLVRELADRSHEVHVATEGNDIAASTRSACRAVHEVRFPRSTSPREFASSIAWLRRIIRKEAFDCVNGHNRNASMVARVAAWCEGVPLNLYTAHGFYFHDDQTRIGWGATVALEALLARITDYTLSQSHEDMAFMTRRGFLRREAIETIGNGIDHRKFTVTESRAAVEARLGLRPGAFRIASVGRLVEGKGFGDLIDAFAGFVSHRTGAGQPFELLIVGGNIEADIDPAARRIAERINSLGIGNRVLVTGVVDNVQDYLHAADLFVSASYREGMPRALLEAMCIGLPVVATRIRGSREIVTEGENGYLFTPKDVAACQRAITQLYDQPEQRSAIGRRNRALVLARYTEDDYTARQVAALERLFGGIHKRGEQHGPPIDVAPSS